MKYFNRIHTAETVKVNLKSKHQCFKIKSRL